MASQTAPRDFQHQPLIETLTNFYNLLAETCYIQTSDILLPPHGANFNPSLGATEGFVKVLFDAASGELLGAHMVGHEVTEMIQGYAIGRQLETTEHELAGTVFAHPTQSEAMHEAVLAAYGRALHS